MSDKDDSDISFDEFLEEVNDSLPSDGEDEDWDFQLDEEGGIIRNKTIPVRTKVMILVVAAIALVFRFAATVLFVFLVLAAVIFLMGVFGLAIPVA